jgi:hypothetical protein
MTRGLRTDLNVNVTSDNPVFCSDELQEPELERRDGHERHSGTTTLSGNGSLACQCEYLLPDVVRAGPLMGSSRNPLKDSIATGSLPRPIALICTRRQRRTIRWVRSPTNHSQLHWYPTGSPQLVKSSSSSRRSD